MAAAERDLRRADAALEFPAGDAAERQHPRLGQGRRPAQDRVVEIQREVVGVIDGVLVDALIVPDERQIERNTREIAQILGPRRDIGGGILVLDKPPLDDRRIHAGVDEDFGFHGL